MVKLQAPKGTTQISVEQQVFDVSEDGTVVVPEPFVDTLRDVGFRILPTRITVSAEAAEAIAAAAKKLNLPVPEGLKLEQTPAQAEIDQQRKDAEAAIAAQRAAAAKTGETKSTEPAALGALAPKPEAGATGNGTTMSEAQMTQEKW